MLIYTLGVTTDFARVPYAKVYTVGRTRKGVTLSVVVGRSEQ